MHELLIEDRGSLLFGAAIEELEEDPNPARITETWTDKVSSCLWFTARKSRCHSWRYEAKDYARVCGCV